jgi:hypothetical protein
MEAPTKPRVTADEIQDVKQSLLRCLRLVALARPTHECGGTSIPARTFDAIPPLIRALELDLPSGELKPVFNAFIGLMYLRDVRIIFGLEHSGVVPAGLEDETYQLLHKLSAHLHPIILPQTPWWRRVPRRILRIMEWLNGE